MGQIHLHNPFVQNGAKDIEEFKRKILGYETQFCLSLMLIAYVVIVCKMTAVIISIISKRTYAAIC
ncbi:hypothetical protein A6J71_11400 [Enterobacter cancerogenus]|nr:hypothetical protein A6J71_11400 [Enterobacter cancerogenus]